ncbi:MAG: CHAT domain-containing protein [Isosphaeraceae bacterium]
MTQFRNYLGGLVKPTLSLPLSGNKSQQTQTQTQVHSRRVTVELECPDVVVPGEEFQLKLHFIPELLGPDRSSYPSSLTVQLVAHDFDLHEGEAWRRDVPLMTPSTLPRPANSIYRLTPRPVSDPDAAVARVIQAVIWVSGEFLSVADRLVAVVKDRGLLDLHPSTQYLRDILNVIIFIIFAVLLLGFFPVPTALFIVLVLTVFLLLIRRRRDASQNQKELLEKVRNSGDTRKSLEMWIMTGVDLTVVILHDSNGILDWSMASPYGSVDTDLEETEKRIDIGNKPEDFTKNLVNDLSASEGMPNRFINLRGVGSRIGEKVPRRFWSALIDVSKAVGNRPPTVLILSEGSYVPWELAWMDDLLIDPKAPPMLAAQAVVGRWPYDKKKWDRASFDSTAEKKREVKRLAFFKADYTGTNLIRLEHAEAEVDELAKTYGGSAIDATMTAVTERLRDNDKDDVLHFALHGQYNPQGMMNGLMVLGEKDKDGKRPISSFTAISVSGCRLRLAPFVFLNACQVGAGAEELAMPSDMAAAFLLEAGASAVVAPLWSINDVVSSEVAERFYSEAGSSSVAAVLRGIRAEFRELGSATPARDGRDLTSLTRMAYVFFGHPNFRLDVKPVAPLPAAPPLVASDTNIPGTGAL